MAESKWVCSVCGCVYEGEGECCDTPMTSISKAIADQLELFDKTGDDMASNVLRRLKDEHMAAVEARAKAATKLRGAEAAEAAAAVLMDAYKLFGDREARAAHADDEAGEEQATTEVSEPEVVDDPVPFEPDPSEVLDEEPDTDEVAESVVESVTDEGGFEMPDDTDAPEIEDEGDGETLAGSLLFRTEAKALVDRTMKLTQPFIKQVDGARIVSWCADGRFHIECQDCDEAVALATAREMVRAAGLDIDSIVEVSKASYRVDVP